MSAAIRIVGCGRWSMGDDRAGLLVAERLGVYQLPDCEILMEETPTNLAEPSPGVELLVVIDAARGDMRRPPGSASRVAYRRPGSTRENESKTDPADPRIRPAGAEAEAAVDGHSLGVPVGLKLAETLGTLPPEVWIYVLFGSDFGRRFSVSDAVAEGVVRLTGRIQHDIQAWRRRGSCTS